MAETGEIGMRRRLPGLVGLWLAAVAGAGLYAAAPQSPEPRAAAPASDVATAEGRRAAFDRYCVTCHNSRARMGDLSLEGLDPSRVSEHPDVWEGVIRKLRTGTMPPHGMPRPDPVTYDRLASYLET